MTTIKFTQRSFSSAAMAVSLLVAGAVCSTKAGASCGDYVQSRQSQGFVQQSASYAGEDDPEIAGPRGLTAPFGQSTPFKKPCSGPECGRSNLPVSPLPVLPFHRIRLNDGLMVSHWLTPSEPRTAFQVCSSSEAHARQGFPRLIEVPPEIVG